MHTTASDGLLTAEELVSLAVRRGVRIISITDHDSIDAIAPAERAAGSFSIEIFPGVEINTDVGESEVHILGYLFEDQELLENKLAALRRERLKRGEAMIGRLKDLGLDVPFDRVLSLTGAASLGRPHVARVMVEQGYVSTVKEAFDKYLAKGGPAYIPRVKFSPMEAIRLISAARGIPVIAHPGKIRDQSLLDELVQHDVKG
ncbi:MAG: PHP domain-containing protein, partial [Armatimonadetes bacterium]|nr:PHP domain-containing protein [Armatimonadota bacterium]